MVYSLKYVTQVQEYHITEVLLGNETLRLAAQNTNILQKGGFQLN